MKYGCFSNSWALEIIAEMIEETSLYVSNSNFFMPFYYKLCNFLHLSKKLEALR